MSQRLRKMSTAVFSPRGLLALGVLWAGFVRMRWLLAHPSYAGDDALITIRHVENLVHHGQLVYNLGSHVQGTTTPLYTLILAALSWLPGTTMLHAGILNLVLDLALLVVIFKLFQSHQMAWVGAGLACLVGSYSVVITASMSRMETPLYVLLIFCAFLFLDRQRTMLMAVALGLLIITRLDGLIAVAAFYGYLTLAERRLPIKEGLLTLAVALPWYTFAFFYYGSPIPQTISAKSIAYKNMFPAGRNRRFLWGLVTSGYRNHRLLLWPFIAYSLIASWKKTRWVLPLMLFAVIYFLAFGSTRTYMFPWYFVPLLVSEIFVAAVGFGQAVELLGPDLFPGRKAGMAALAVSVVLVGWLSVTMEGRAADLMAPYWDSQPVGDRIGIWLSENTPAQSSVFTEPVGAIGYYSDHHMLDAVALVAPEVLPYVARSPMKGNFDNYAEAINTLQPDYAVLRQNEYTGFQQEDLKVQFDQSYAQIHADGSFLVFARQ